MKKNNAVIGIHALQVLPPSCVNRDETGSPKKAGYGGCDRGRIASQALKKAMRDMFTDELGEEGTGKRTKKVAEMVAKEILSICPDMDEDEAASLAVKALEAAGISFADAEEDGSKASPETEEKAGKRGSANKPKKETKALTYLSWAQAKALAELAASGGKLDKKACKKAVTEGAAPDMVFFGRMMAKEKDLSYDAVTQVSHAISTHRAYNELDFFTAMDDLKKDSSGAGHKGYSQFNSMTTYRYASIDVREAYSALKGDTAEAAAMFVDAFVRSMPQGKIHAFANHTLPYMVYVTFNTDMSIYLGDAFEKPVESSGGYAELSEQRFVEHAKKQYENYGWPEKAAAFGNNILEIAEKADLEGILEKVKEWVREWESEAAAM